MISCKLRNIFWKKWPAWPVERAESFDIQLRYEKQLWTRWDSPFKTGAGREGTQSLPKCFFLENAPPFLASVYYVIALLVWKLWPWVSKVRWWCPHTPSISSPRIYGRQDRGKIHPHPNLRGALFSDRIPISFWTEFPDQTQFRREKRSKQEKTKQKWYQEYYANRFGCCIFTSLAQISQSLPPVGMNSSQHCKWYVDRSVF